jgi:hypothetical protein
VGAVNRRFFDLKMECNLLAIMPGSNHRVDDLNDLYGKYGRPSPPLVDEGRNGFKVVGVDAGSNEAEMVDVVASGDRALMLHVIRTVSRNCPTSRHDESPTVAILISRLLPNPARRFISSILDDVIQGSAMVVVKKILRLASCVPTFLTGQLRNQSWFSAATHAQSRFVLRRNQMRIGTTMADAVAAVLGLYIPSLMGSVDSQRRYLTAAAHADAARIWSDRRAHWFRRASMAAQKAMRLAFDESPKRDCRFCNVGLLTAAAMAIAERNFHASSPSRTGWRPWGSPALTSVSKADALLA